MLDSLIKAYRNSIGDEGLFLHAPKICFWNTGVWGSDPGKLFDTELMSYEMEMNENFSEDNN